MTLGSYRGFGLDLRFDTFRNEYQAVLRGATSHFVPLGTDARGNLTRLDNVLDSFPDRIARAENQLQTLYQQRDAAQVEVEKPFPKEVELAEKIRPSGRTGYLAEHGGPPRAGARKTGGRTGRTPALGACRAEKLPQPRNSTPNKQHKKEAER